MENNNNKEISINTIGDSVREKVKKAIFDSIPDIAVEELIRKELALLTQDRKGDWSAFRKSELNEIIEKELKEQLTIIVKEDVTKYIEETYINNSKELVNEAVKELAPLFMASMSERFAAMAVQDIKNSLWNKGIMV